MQVTVRAVGFFKKYLDSNSQVVPIEIKKGTTIDILLQQIGIPENEVMRVAVNDLLVPFDHVLCDGDMILVIPPIAAG